MLGRLGARRPETLVGASLGVDAAVVAFDADSVCVLTTDPITTATSGAGRLAVHVVCNDLAVMGAEPVGVLATLLFPAGVAAETIATLTSDIDAAARELNVEVLGGHTEIAPGVSAPLVVMTGVGRAPRNRLITAAGCQVGDALVLTRAAALEGTCILANDFADRLSSVTPAMLAEALGYANELSVVADARRAAALGAHAMHDPTEGGIVGATWEMAEASGAGFRLYADRIPIRPATRAICTALGADPLRLIASGALLIACPDGEAMARALNATVIGQITPSTRELIHPEGRIENIATLDRDELYRLLEQA